MSPTVLFPKYTVELAPMPLEPLPPSTVEVPDQVVMLRGPQSLRIDPRPTNSNVLKRPILCSMNDELAQPAGTASSQQFVYCVWLTDICRLLLVFALNDSASFTRPMNQNTSRYSRLVSKVIIFGRQMRRKS